MKTKEISCTTGTKINLGNFETMDVSFSKTVILEEEDLANEAACRSTLLLDIRKGLHEQVLIVKKQLKEQKAAYHA